MTLVENNNIFREYMGYSKAYTRNGVICYYLKGGRIAKKDVPTDIIKHLPTDRELTFFSIEERRIRDKKPYTGFSFLSSHGRKIYFFNNERIAKRIIKEKEFENMYDKQQRWKEQFENYFNKRQKHSEQKYNTNSELPEKEPEPNKTYQNMSPFELLRNYNINTKKEWRQWMLKNHPDKKPDTDIDLVGLINVAASIVFD